MIIGDIEKNNCTECPLISMCTEGDKNPGLCMDERIEDVDVDEYEQEYEKCGVAKYFCIKEKAEELGLDIEAPSGIIAESELEINYNKAFLEYFIDNKM